MSEAPKTEYADVASWELSDSLWERTEPLLPKVKSRYRRRLKLRKLPPHYDVPTEPLPVAAGRISFIRQVSPNDNVHLLSQTFKVGKRLKGEYVKVVLDTRGAHLTVYRQCRIFKRWPYPFVKQ